MDNDKLRVYLRHNYSVQLKVLLLVNFYMMNRTKDLYCCLNQ